ncbi:hypothetical protein KAJ89_03475 [Candidatus Parcubacteria bacterium]|nr:hypothetical protein [Candidatus Parcubacteria bacterium]
MLRKKTLIFIIVFVLIFSGGFYINKINNEIEWKIAVKASGGMSTQLGITEAKLTQCTPSCQNPSGTSLCCAPQVNSNCASFVPGVNGTYDSACSLFSDVRGTQAGGTGSDGLFSQEAIAQAGLKAGGQLIYGGTTNNMSMMTPGDPNVVLASAGGCYNCLSKADWKENLKIKFKYFIAMIKD